VGEKMKRKIKRRNSIVCCFFIIAAISCASCRDEIQSKRKLIADSNYRLWKEDQNFMREKSSASFYWYFNKQNKFDIYIKYKNRNIIEKPDAGDIELIETWSMVSPTKVSIGGKVYKIRLLNDSCFFLKDTALNQDIKLIYHGDKLP